MPVPVEGKFGMRDVIARLIIGCEALASARRPTDRTLEAPRRPGQNCLLRIMLALVAEAAAHIGRDDAHCGLCDPKLLGDETANVVRHLRRAVEREAVRLRIGDNSARLHGGASKPIIDEIDPRHVRGGLELLRNGFVVAAAPFETDISRG